MLVSGYSSGFLWAVAIAAFLTLIPLFAVAFFGESIARRAQTLPTWVRMVRPAVLCVPYVLVSVAGGMFRWRWLLLYALLPVVVAGLMLQAKRVDPERLGTWRDFLVLATLGLAVDLRWFEGGWPAHLAAFNRYCCWIWGSTDFLFCESWMGLGLIYG